MSKEIMRDVNTIPSRPEVTESESAALLTRQGESGLGAQLTRSALSPQQYAHDAWIFKNVEDSAFPSSSSFNPRGRTWLRKIKSQDR